MQVKVFFSVRDLAVGAFMNPFLAPSKGAAVRSFMDEVNREGSEMYKHPEDYELYSVGKFDDESGVVESFAKPELVMRAVEVIKEK